MAISFNFNSNISPVKEISYSCTNCVHYCPLSQLVARCHSNFNFNFANKNIIDNCNKFDNKSRERILYISFAVFAVENNGLVYSDSGIGFMLNTRQTDYELIKNLKNNKEFLNGADKRLYAEYNRYPAFELIIAAERLNNKQWVGISTVLPKEQMDTIINNLNRESSSTV